MKQGFTSNSTQCYVSKLKYTRKGLWSWSCTKRVNVVPCFYIQNLLSLLTSYQSCARQPTHFHVTHHRKWAWIRTSSLRVFLPILINIFQKSSPWRIVRVAEYLWHSAMAPSFVSPTYGKTEGEHSSQLPDIYPSKCNIIITIME